MRHATLELLVLGPVAGPPGGNTTRLVEPTARCYGYAVAGSLDLLDDRTASVQDIVIFALERGLCQVFDQGSESHGMSHHPYVGWIDTLLL